MALDLNEYIKMSYKRPNRKVLEALGASEDLIEYLMETPGNTNWNMLNNMSNNENKTKGIILFEGSIVANQKAQNSWGVVLDGMVTNDEIHAGDTLIISVNEGDLSCVMNIEESIAIGYISLQGGEKYCIYDERASEDTYFEGFYINLTNTNHGFTLTKIVLIRKDDNENNS